LLGAKEYINMNNDLLNAQSKLAEELMKSQDPHDRLKYHNWNHVQQVKRAVQKLSEASNLSPLESENLILAAIWHDVDYANGAEDHEKRSAEIAKQELEKIGLDQSRIQQITSLIEVTKMGKAPESKLEAIMKDADLGHLAADDYFQYYEGLYSELKGGAFPELNPTSWKNKCLKFFEDHHYHSDKAQEMWSDGKKQNIEAIKKIEINQEMEEKEHVQLELTKEERKALKKKRKKDGPKFNAEKGIETMFRVTLRNHINLSRIADDKANTLISVNAIILSIVLSALFPKMDSNPWLIYPGMALILVSISTIILSTLSTIPKTTHGTVSMEDVKNKRGNLLFFGNFHKMSLEEFEFGIGELMKDGSYLYGSLTRDLYFLGRVLDRKYGLLRKAYVVFVIGLVISILLFAWSILTLAPEIANPETIEIL